MLLPEVMLPQIHKNWGDLYCCPGPWRHRVCIQVAVARGRIWVLGPTIVRVWVEVYDSYYHQRPCNYLGSVSHLEP